jgi:outer membrane lipopolysaccharide assembly protein LptE/RlpB
MNKKIFLFLTLVLLAGCGFTPMLKDFDMSKLKVQKINYSGKRELIYLTKTYLNIKEEKNITEGILLNISIAESTNSVIKNAAGINTEEDLIINMKINVTNNKGNNLLSDEISSSKRIKVSNNVSSDEEVKRVERRNLLRDLTQKIKFKLLILTTQDQ